MIRACRSRSTSASGIRRRRRSRSRAAGGAHEDHEGAALLLRDSIATHLEELSALSLDELLQARRAKFRSLGVLAGSGSAGA